MRMTDDTVIKTARWLVLAGTIGTCMLPLHAQEELFSIGSFEAGLRSITVAGNLIISPLKADTLERLLRQPALGREELLLRRRFGPSEYGLYRGKRTRGSFDNLSVFAPPPAMTVNTLLYRKIYMSQTDNPNMDVADVYFDAEYIYVENAVKIYYVDNGRQSLTMIGRSGGKLTVTSIPDSATVFIDGAERGKTPLVLDNLLSPYCIIKVLKTGCYQADAFTYCGAGTDVVRHLILPPIIASSEGAYCNPFTYTSESPASVEELDRQIKKLREKIAERKTALEESLAGFEKKYPPLPDRGEFEKSEDFMVRKGHYTEKKESGRIVLLADGNPRVCKLEDDLLKLTGYRAEIDHRLYYFFLKTGDVALGRYEADREYFPVNIRVNQSGHRFTFTGTLQVPLSQAAEFKENLNTGRLKLTYKNRIFSADAPQSASKILYEYVKLSILFRGGEYMLEGTCSFPGRARQSRESAPDGDVTITVNKRGK
jgi:hypothetical protein